jgi:thiol-disulfide isomerase/thioredoxin
MKFSACRAFPDITRRCLQGGLCFMLVVATVLRPVMLLAADQPILRGYSSQFIYLRPLETVGPAQFLDDAGRPVDFNRFRGKVVLVNFWATWCPPCAYEMPSLVRLQAEIGGDRFTVVAIALDTAGLEAVTPFLRRQGLSHLAICIDASHRTIYTDAQNAKGAPFALYALPISYLIDHHGRAVGYLKGAADWTSSDARNFLRHFIAEAADGGK